MHGLIQRRAFCTSVLFNTFSSRERVGSGYETMLSCIIDSLEVQLNLWYEVVKDKTLLHHALLSMVRQPKIF